MSEAHQNSVLDDPYVKKIQEKFASQNIVNWHESLFHYADVKNAVGIINDGILLCRKLAQQNQKLKKDSASSDIIENTPEEFKEYVRLYFRPHTPPLFHVEGFRPNDNRDSELGSHCPVPVYLLFGFKDIFSKNGVKFSDRNLASPSRNLYESTKDLLKLDFESIYHNTPLPKDNPAEKKAIILKRCAEVIIKDKLELKGNLQYIVCRSTAERELLLNLINEDKRIEYTNRILVRPQLFFHMWHYVKSVDLRKDSIKFEYGFKDGYEFSPGIFNYEYIFKSWDRNKKQTFDVPIKSFNVNIPHGDYSISLSIDGHPAYMGNYEDLPSPL